MLSKSKFQTQKFAIRLAKKILRANRPEQSRGATVIALCGDLGAGKTTFAQGFIKALGVKHHITSPTFVIFRKYHLSQKSKVKSPWPGSQKFFNVFHFDLYRIHRPKEILDLGFKKILQDPYAIVLIEWPERIEKLLPKNIIKINFEHGKNVRQRRIRLLAEKRAYN